MKTQEWWQEGGGTNIRPDGLARALGWFSVGLGLAEVAAPGAIARLIGISDEDERRTILRALGVREIATGLAILSDPKEPSWMWGRVGGDALDLALLGAAIGDEDNDRGRLGAAMAVVAGMTVLDVICGQRLSRNGVSRHREQDRAVRIREAVTINRQVEDVYGFWRDFQNLPGFMRHLESVEVLGDRRSRWKARGPAGTRVEWEAEITDERPNEYLAWRAVEGADVAHRGSIRFQQAPGRRGTELRVDLEYTPPGGALGRTIAWLFGEEPELQLRDDLRRFKQLMETGEIPLSEGPGLWRPAQPPQQPEDILTLVGVSR